MTPGSIPGWAIRRLSYGLLALAAIILGIRTVHAHRRQRADPSATAHVDVVGRRLGTLRGSRVGVDTPVTVSLGTGGVRLVILFSTSCGFCAASRASWVQLVNQLSADDTVVAVTIESGRAVGSYFGPGVDVLHAVSSAEIRNALGPEFGREVPVTIVIGNDGRVRRALWGQVGQEDVRQLRDAINR